MATVDAFAALRTSAALPGTPTAAAPAEREQAMLWLNVGYWVELVDEQGEIKKEFVSLPMGIPVDTMKTIGKLSSNPDFANLQSAKNQLLADLIKVGKELKPGQTCDDLPLTLQLRRVAEPVKATAAAANPFVAGNPFAR